MNYFDIAILAIVAIGLLLGFIKGFKKKSASSFGWLISIALAIILAKTVAGAICNIPFVSKYFFGGESGFSFTKWIYGILPKSLRVDMNTTRGWIVENGAIVENADNILLKNIKSKNSFVGFFLEIFKTSYIGSITTPELLTYNFANLAEVIALLFANTLLVIFTAIILMIVFKIIVGILMKILERSVNTSKDKVSLSSRIFGMIVGGIKSAVFCVVIFVLLSFMINYSFLSRVKENLTDKDTVITAKAADYVFKNTDKLLKNKYLTKILEVSKYESTINLTEPQTETEPETATYSLHVIDSEYAAF